MKPLPKKLTQKLYISALRESFPEPRYMLSLDSFDMTAGSSFMGHIHVGTVEVTVDIPECNPIQAEIDAITKARDNVLAEAQLKANQLNERIQKLLCIEHNPS